MYRLLFDRRILDHGYAATTRVCRLRKLLANEKSCVNPRISASQSSPNPDSVLRFLRWEPTMT